MVIVMVLEMAYQTVLVMEHVRAFVRAYLMVLVTAQ